PGAVDPSPRPPPRWRGGGDRWWAFLALGGFARWGYLTPCPLSDFGEGVDDMCLRRQAAGRPQPLRESTSRPYSASTDQGGEYRQPQSGLSGTYSKPGAVGAGSRAGCRRATSLWGRA